MRLAELHDRTILYRRGDFIFVTYGLFASAAFVATLASALWFGAASGIEPSRAARFYLGVMLPAVLIGARAASILVDRGKLGARPLETLLRPGYVLHGGVIGGAAALVGFSVATDAPLLVLLDAWALAMPLGEAICRLGCYVYGCCWGKPTGSAAGVAYSSPHAKVVRFAPHLRGAHLHPTQLYSSLAALGLLALLTGASAVDPAAGVLAGVYLVVHGALRAAIERLRCDDRGTLWRSLTHTNGYSLLLGVAGFVCLVAGTAARDLPVHLDLAPASVLLLPAPLASLVLVGVAAAIAFGVHLGEVGRWVGGPTTPTAYRPRTAPEALSASDALEPAA